MRTTAAILSFVASTLAYQVTSPTNSSGWTPSGPNVLTWQRVDTDPSNFTAVLTNQNQAVMSPNNQILAALVDGTLGSMTMNPPSGGWPTGSGFQVNLVRDAESLSSILAQSGLFSIQSATSSGASSTIHVSTASNTPSGSVTTPVVPNGGLNPTTSDTSTTPTGSPNAALPALHVQTGFVGLLAFLATLFT